MCVAKKAKISIEDQYIDCHLKFNYVTLTSLMKMSLLLLKLANFIADSISQTLFESLLITMYFLITEY